MYQESNTAWHSKSSMVRPWALASVLPFWRHLNLLDMKAYVVELLLTLYLDRRELYAHSAVFHTLLCYPFLAT